MKLILRDNRIIGESGDSYTGPEQFVQVPLHLEKYNISDYIIKNGVIELDIEHMLSSAIQQRLDNFAKTRGYDSILSACSYATSNILKFSQEGQQCVNLRDSTWAKLYDILSEIKDKKRIAPESFAEIESEFPELIWTT